MRTLRLGTIVLNGYIKVNDIDIESINKNFDTVGQARKYLSKLTYNGHKVNVKGKNPKHGEFYFYGELFKKLTDSIKRLDRFHC